MGTSSLFVIPALAAKDGCAIATADVPGAYYLEADMTKRPAGHEGGRLAAIPLIDPTLKPPAKPGGTFVVLNKALYGCTESAPALV
jgi:hypothetical protein